MNYPSDFVYDVLDTVAKHDAHSDIWWRTDGKYAPITIFVNCNDTFAWGTSDAEDLTPENLSILKQSYIDSKNHGAELFCAHVRQMRPQGAFYTYIPKDEWHLFDACGPEREVNYGNPYAPGDYKPIGANNE